MKFRFISISLLSITLSLSNSTFLYAQAKGNFWDGLFGGGKSSSSSKQNSKSSGSLTNSEVTNGLKEALKIGAQNASKQLSSTDGFFQNQAIKIFLPAEVKEVERTLRSVGMGSLVDKAILSLNRAAEDASKQAAPIFVNAITSMSIQDAMGILTGGENSATMYLQNRTTTQLTNSFRPVIQSSLNKVGAVDLWKNVFSTYNNLPLVQNKVNPDLIGYVTERALVGLFQTIAIEEKKIRTDPAAQVTNLLRKVFGSKK